MIIIINLKYDINLFKIKFINMKVANWKIILVTYLNLGVIVSMGKVKYRFFISKTLSIFILCPIQYLLLFSSSFNYFRPTFIISKSFKVATYRDINLSSLLFFMSYFPTSSQTYSNISIHNATKRNQFSNYTEFFLRIPWSQIN